MAVDERDRHRFYTKAIEVFGENEATILMAHLPPGGWPNLATKQDLLELEQRLKSDLKAFTFRTIITVNLVTSGIFAGIAFTAAGLGG